MNLPGQPHPSPPEGYHSFPVPEHAELVVDAARRSREKLLHWNLARITVGEWSRLLVQALDGVRDETNADYVPLWVAFPALWCLGLGGLVSRLFELFKTPSKFELQAEQMGAIMVDDWLQLSAVTLSPLLLLLARDEGSLADVSPPSPEQGVLAVRQGEITAEARLLWLIPMDQIAAVLIEHEGPIDRRAAISLPPELMSVPRIQITQQPYDSASPHGPDELYGIRSLSEVIERITNLERPPQRVA